MDLIRYVVKAVVLEGLSVREVAAAHGVSRSWVYECLARHRAEGDQGLFPRSRRPHSSPTLISLLGQLRVAATDNRELVRGAKRRAGPHIPRIARSAACGSADPISGHSRVAGSAGV